MMKDYYQQSMRALQLAGMSQRTQECYTRSVRMLAEFYNKTRDQITESQLQDYFLHRRNNDNGSPATMRICYSALFAASAETIKKLAKDPKHVGGDLPGFFGVLHTWGRQLQYHPHIHYVVPGGALSKTDNRWHPSRLDFFLPVKALSKVFKAKLYDIMKKNNLYPDIPQDTWQQGFVVNCQSVGNPHQSLQYLSRYVFKVAISGYRIVNVENRKVRFKYKKSGSHRWRTICLEVMEFMRRFLQHVLPTGFMKVRYYGFLNPNCSVAFEKVSALIQLTFGFLLKEPDCQIQAAKPLTCPACGGNLLYRASILPHRMQFIGAG